MLEDLNKLDKNEFDKFEDFVNSPYFNRYKTLTKLFDYLKVRYPGISKEDVSPKQLSISIYSQKRVNNVKIRKLISDFSLLFEKFIMLTEFDSDEHEKKYYLIKSLRKRNMDKRFKHNYIISEKMILSPGLSIESKYLNNMRIRKEWTEFEVEKNTDNIFQNLKNDAEGIDFYFVFQKLNNFHYIRANSIFFNKEYTIEKNFHNEIFTFIENNLVKIKGNYKEIYLLYLILKNKVSNIDELENFYKLNKDTIKGELLKIYLIAVEGFYRGSFSNVTGNFKQNCKKLFQFYNHHYIQNEPPKELLINGHLPDFVFNGIVNLAIELKNYPWLNEFIEKAIKYVSPLYLNDAYSMARTRYHFALKNFDMALFHLKDITNIKPEYYYLAKFFLIRIYYETDNYEGIKSVLSNLNQYVIKTKKLSDLTESSIKVFMKYIRKLARLKFQSDSKNFSDLLILKDEIDREKRILAAKRWFYEKIAELEKSKK